MCYSVQSRGLIFVRSYEFLSFTKMGKHIGKNINKNLSGKYGQKRLNHTKQSATDTLKTSSKRFIQKSAEATVDLIGSKNADRITKVSKTSRQNNSETVTNEHDKEIPKERYISPEERQKIIDNLRSIIIV